MKVQSKHDFPRNQNQTLRATKAPPLLEFVNFSQVCY